MGEEHDENTNTSFTTDQDDGNAAIRKFLGNLFDVGTLCTFEDLEDTENPILAGKIVKIEPLTNNVDVEGCNAMVLTLKEVFHYDGSAVFRRFFVFFLGEAATVMAKTELKTRDYIAIHRPTLIRNPIFSLHPRKMVKIVLIIGAPAGNQVQDVYGRERKMKDWHKLSEYQLRRSITKRKHRQTFPSEEQGERRGAGFPEERTSSDQIDRPTISDAAQKYPATLRNNDERKAKDVTDTNEAASALDLADSDQIDVIPSSLDAHIDCQQFMNAVQRHSATLSNDEQEKKKDVMDTNETSALQSTDSDQIDVIPSSLDTQINHQQFMNAAQERPIILPSNEREEEKDTTNTEKATSVLEPTDSEQIDVIPNSLDAQIDNQKFVNAAQEHPITLPNNEREEEKGRTDTEKATSASQPANSDQIDVIPNSLDVQTDEQTSTTKQNPKESRNETGSVLTRASLNGALKKGVLGSFAEKVTQLKDIQDGMNVTVFGVILNQKEPRFNRWNKSIARIEITDETCKKFPVEFYLSMEEFPLTLRQFDVIKLRNMDIKTYKNELYGKVTKTRDVVTYARENPAIMYNQTQSYEYTMDDSKRVKKLIRWMQGNVPGAHMFTRLCDLKNISANVHLLGTVVAKKLFKHSKNLLLRLRDGTQTTQYFHEFDFSKESFFNCKKEIPVQGSDYADVVVLDASPKFRNFIRRLEVGTLIELYDVRTSPQSYTFKTVSGCAISLHFMAIEKKLRIREPASPPESQVPEFQAPELHVLDGTTTTESRAVDQQLECLEQPKTTTRKRKLFNDDEPIIFNTETDLNPCKKKMTEVKKNSKAVDESNCNTHENGQTRSTEGEENHESVDEINSSQVENVESECTRMKVDEPEDEKTMIHDTLELMSSNAANCDKDPLCSPLKIVVPPADDLSDVRTVPNSPEGNTSQGSPRTPQNRVENIASQTPAEFDLQKALMENLYLQTREVMNVGTDPSNFNSVPSQIEFEYLEEWPHSTQDEFWMKVSVISTLPVITNASNDKDVLSLISAHCAQCNKYTPFFFITEWTPTEKGFTSSCPSCRVNGKEIQLRHLIMADLLLGDRHGKAASAIVAGCTAEQFFDCTMAELITSKITQLRVKNFILNSRVLFLKLKVWKTTVQSTKYVVLARR